MLAIVSIKLPLPGVFISFLLPLMNLKAIEGRLKASFIIKSWIFEPSVLFVRKNFLRAGVLKNKSSTKIVVPSEQPISCTS